MEEETVIKVENVSKKFVRSLKRSMAYGTIDLARNFLGIPTDQSYLRKGEFWALKDINFELKKGEILGIIGENGSGKSTLLRILTGIFPPDAGKITVKGKVGALIAVGAGFHPYMSGRDNIYLNGTILGMSKRELDEKFNNIVEFAEIGDFLDAPVATYSSGMKVRLGFAIAVHRIPEVLLVDEVLSVGDAAFKKKCMEKMEEIKQRCSIIFISHNMNQIERICDQTILIHKGEIVFHGDTNETINAYYNITINKELGKSEKLTIFESTKDIQDINLRILDSKGLVRDTFNNDEDISFEFRFFSKIDANNPILGVGIVSGDGVLVASSKNIDQENRINKILSGENIFKITFKKISLLPNNYRLYFKWKLADNTTLIEATGGNFAIKSNLNLLSYDGVVKLESTWT